MSAFKSVYKPLSFFILACLFSALSMSTPLRAQHLYPKKELIFTQVIAMPGFYSVIALTNRGTGIYSASMFLSTGAVNTAWNPLVNGEQVTNGTVQVSIPPDETKIFYITDTEFKVGLAFLSSWDFWLENHAEGNLTYYSFTEDIYLDAVGVPGSSEFFNVSLPFSKFSDVGLSLGNISGDHATVDVVLFDNTGFPVSNCQFTVLSGGHFAAYLKELPWTVPIGSFGPVGKVDIQTDVSLSGIAMTVTPDGNGGAQISTLPLDATPLVYTLGLTSGTDTYMGRLTLWIEGYFVKGYMTLTQENGEFIQQGKYGSVPFMVSGRLKNESLDLAFVTDGWPTAAQGHGVSLYLHFWDFDVSSDEMNGDWSADHILDPGVGTITGDAIINNMKIE